jgi:hypothetical protein
MLKAKCFKHETVSLNICAFCGILLCNCLSVSSRLVTVLRAELSGVWIHTGAEVFCRLQNVQTGSWAHPASYPVDTRVPFRGVKWQGRQVDLSPPVPRSKINGAIPLFPLYASVVRKATWTLLYHYFPSMPWSTKLRFQVYRLSLYVFLIPYALHTPSILYFFIRLTTQAQMHEFILWTKTVNKKLGGFNWGGGGNIAEFVVGGP